MSPRALVRRFHRAVAAALVTLVAATLTAAAAQAQARPVVHVYSSLPLQGASGDQTRTMVNGMRLALAQSSGVAGDVRVRYTSLDDSTAQAGNWEPNQVAKNARRAAVNDRTVAFIGDFNSGATAISLPILNQLGIAQISPSNTYDGLTAKAPGTERGEPDKYYPAGARTYMRLVPRDAFQADAIVARMKQDGCTRLAVARDGDTYGNLIAAGMARAAKERGLAVVLRRRARRGPTGARVYAAATRRTRADCFAFAGVTQNGAARLYRAVARARPAARLYGPDGVCESGFTDPRRGGISSAVGRRFTCFIATLALREYPGGAAFSKAYRVRFGGGSVDPYGIYGYEAMQLVLDTLRGLGPRATDRAAVSAALLATKGRASSIGTYSFDAGGDTTNHRYGVYRVSGGRPTYAGFVDP